MDSRTTNGELQGRIGNCTSFAVYVTKIDEDSCGTREKNSGNEETSFVGWIVIIIMTEKLRF